MRIIFRCVANCSISVKTLIIKDNDFKGVLIPVIK